MNDETNQQGTGKTRLFISYSRSDAASALPLIHALEQAGYAVWWDGMLQGGENFLPTTEAALEGADAVVVLWSKTSVESHWVRDEATVGRDRRRLVPLSIDGTQPPLGFRQFQFVDVQGWDGRAEAAEFRRIIDAIANVSGQAPPRPLPPPPAGAAPARPAASFNRRWLLGAGAVLVAGAGAGVWRWQSGSGTAANSVAVLPFRNLSGDASQDYFAEGLTEELRTTLSFNRQLLVSGAASAGGFRAADVDARAVASALGVATVLVGSVRQAGNRVRVSARLLDGTTGFERWSNAFERGLADLLAVQSEIAARVADALISTLAKDPQWRAERPGGTHDSAAFDAYVKGQALYDANNGEASDRAALAAFDQAIARDPGYAAAHAARARVLAAMANSYANGAGVARLRAQSLAAARKAIVLAPDMAEGHAALGLLFKTALDFSNASAAYGRAFELGFGNAPIISAYAQFAADMGHVDRAAAAMERARALDPLNPAIFLASGFVHYAARNYGAAAEALNTALSLNPSIGGAHLVLGDIAYLKGDIAGARAQYDQESSKLLRLRGLAMADARAGDAAAADGHMAAMIAAFGDNSLYQQAQLHCQRGNAEKALAALSRAYDVKDAGLTRLRNDPLLDPVRQAPAFGALLARLGVTPR